VPAVIAVLAGVNGAGKSSILGPRFLRDQNLTFFNPDEFARRLHERTGWSMADANSEAWTYMVDQLKEAIANGTSFAFETTLGGRTITRLLLYAAQSGMKVLILFVGLSSPELHILRVRERVRAGGHDIPEEKIRERWQSSRQNLIELLPHIAEVRLFDNSEEGDPAESQAHAPRLLLHWLRGVIVAPDAATLANTPEWAKAIVACALKTQRTQ
jgi:predicted ABC-type ATPase